MIERLVVPNTQARYFYGIVGALSAALAVGAAFTGDRWWVLGVEAVAWTWGLRYVIPLSVTVDDLELVFRWPLRRVRVSPDTLLRARSSPTAASRHTVALRVARSASFNVTLSQYSEPDLVRAGLLRVVEGGRRLSDQQRQEAVAALSVTAHTRHQMPPQC